MSQKCFKQMGWYFTDDKRQVINAIISTLFKEFHSKF